MHISMVICMMQIARGGQLTLNCPRATYMAEGDDELLFTELKRLMNIAVAVLKVKAKWMTKIVEGGRMPFATGTHLPPNADISLAERIKIEHIFFPFVDGGDIMHVRGATLKTSITYRE